MAYELAGMNMILFIVLVIWSAIWKGVGLWRAGRNNHLVWFLFMFIFNTAGILPIVYLVFFSKSNSFKKKVNKKEKVLPKNNIIVKSKEKLIKN